MRNFVLRLFADVPTGRTIVASQVTGPKACVYGSQTLTKEQQHSKYAQQVCLSIYRASLQKF